MSAAFGQTWRLILSLRGGRPMTEGPFTERERHALAKLDAAIQTVYELPCISEADFQQVVLPALQDIQRLIGTRATYRRVRAF